MKNNEPGITKETQSPKRDSSPYSSESLEHPSARPSGVTARHTSKDTVTSGQGKSRKGRRYHEVNKSDVITPNSPRRYQEYFKSYDKRPTTAA